jgi:hypothetical protein
MSREGSIELTWAGDLRIFRLGIDQLLALQDARDSGPMEIVNRLRQGTWRIDDIRDPIRLGLIGAGMDGKKARSVVEQHVSPGAIGQHVLVAMAVILAALQGDVNDPVGKEQVATTAPEATASPPPPSTETARP